MHMAMHAFVHERTSPCFHALMSVFFYDAGKHARTHGCLHAYTLSCMQACVNTRLLACNACICLFSLPKTSCTSAKSYQSPVRASSHLYCSHMIYRSFCNLTRVTRKWYHRICGLRRFRTVCAYALHGLAL